MSGELGRTIQRAIDRFVAEIAAAAEAAAIDAIEAVFACESARRPRPASVAIRAPTAAPKNRGSEAGNSAETPARVRSVGAPTPRAARAEVKHHALWRRIVDYLRSRPGSHMRELTRTLGVPPARLRRHLYKLADRGVVRIDVYYDPALGRERHSFTALGACEPASSPSSAENSQSAECQAPDKLSGDSSESADRRTVSSPSATSFSRLSTGAVP